jgi:hypothetical protein
VSCGHGLPTLEDCAILHWCPATKAEREGKGWRAPCPICQTRRALEFSIDGKRMRWNSFCGDHDREEVRPALRNLLKACMPGKERRPQVTADDVAELGLSAITSALSLKLVLLEMSGMNTTAALDKLGVRRENRSRVIAGARIKSDT